MQTDIILLLVILFVVICFGAGCWLFVRLVRELQATTQRQLEANVQEMQVLVVTTQNALAIPAQRCNCIRAQTPVTLRFPQGGSTDVFRSNLSRHLQPSVWLAISRCT